jgi:hypothetical protein
MLPQTYVRKPFLVKVFVVTDENLEYVASWCGGTVQQKTDGPRYIKVPVLKPMNDRHTEAFVGDSVLKSGTTFKVYLSRAFNANFDLVAAINDHPTTGTPTE